MRKSLEVALPAIVVAIVTQLVINPSITYVLSPRGEVMIGSVTFFGPDAYVPVEVRNYGSKPVMNLRLQVPGDTRAEAVTSTHPVKFELLSDESGSTDSRRATVSGIEPGRATTIFVPVRKHTSVLVLNAREVHLTVVNPEMVEDVLSKMILPTVVQCVLYAVAFGVFISFLSGKHSKYQERIRETESKLASHMGEIDGIKNSLARMKVLYAARLSDYAKELEFWRNTIRKILSSSRRRVGTRTEQIIRHVTESLKTYGTLTDSVAFDFDVLKATAAMIEKPGKRLLSGDRSEQSESNSRGVPDH